ncbi:MAG: hypothetical protein NUV54_02375 [Candidatus Taylorbacteria bacterium]|nr:hypothetical protein [Candidatus Taylorbacteria bacterium]
MDFTFLVLKIFSVYLVLSGLFLIVRGKTLPLLLKDLFAHPAVVYLAGAFLVCAGALLVIQQNVWDGTLRTLVTVIGWLTLLKGVVYLFFPKVFADLPMKKLRNWFGLLGLALIIAGAYLYQLL